MTCGYPPTPPATTPTPGTGNPVCPPPTKEGNVVGTPTGIPVCAPATDVGNPPVNVGNPVCMPATDVGNPPCAPPIQLGIPPYPCCPAPPINIICS